MCENTPKENDGIITAVHLLKRENYSLDLWATETDNGGDILTDGQKSGKLQAAILVIESTLKSPPGDPTDRRDENKIVNCALDDMLHDLEFAVGGLRTETELDPENHHLQLAYEAMERTRVRLCGMLEFHATIYG